MNTDCLLLFAAGAAACGAAAAALLSRRERSHALPAFACGMALLGAESILAGMSASSILPRDVLLWQQWRLLTLACLPGCWLLFSLTYARGNAGETLRRWMPVLTASVVLPVGLVLLSWPHLLTGEIEEDTMWLVGLRPAGIFLNILFIGGFILCVMNLEYTLRAAVGTMRWRIKYMIAGLGILFAVRCYSATQAVLYSAVNMDLAPLNAGALLAGCILMLMALKRGALSPVDLYPSHSVLYGSLTVLVAGSYLILVGLLAEAAAYSGIGRSFRVAAFLVLMGMLGLALILLSDRLRQRTKRFIARHFHRPQYDYRQVWTTFSERTASLTESGAFCRAVATLVSETFDLLSVTVWLMDESGRHLVPGASTSLTESEARELIGPGTLDSDVARRLHEQSFPSSLRDTTGLPGTLLQTLGHKAFKNGGECLFLPLSTKEELVGVLVVGDRVSGLPFTLEELELLKTIGHQIAADLLNIKLASRLIETKKLEAFQTMSAFFVHDLKNTATSLSLMLENLPRHFEDPAFRRDALNGISKSVEKINGLIGRLSYFRQKIDVKPVAGDLNAVVKSTLAGLGGCAPDPFATNLTPLPPVMMDADQIQKVLTNLLLNARDASRPGGRIEVGTAAAPGWAILRVSDQGCGMAPEFIQHSLFRPFQTTKPDGIGIGLFHSKMIIEAHQGRIEVESRRGEGSTFRVFLPVQGEPA